MPVLDIGGRRVQVDESFLKLSPEQQNDTVDEIASSFAPKQKQPTMANAVTDIPSEIANAAGEGWKNLKGVANRSQQGPIEGLLNTGKAALAPLQIAMSPITGTARSVLGHGLTQATHAIGGLISPDIAAKDDLNKMYETAKGDVDLAMSAMASRGAPVRSAPAIAAPSEGQQVVSAGQRLSDAFGDVSVPRAIASDSMAVQRLGQGIRNVPIVGDAIPKATLRLSDDLGRAVGSVADQYGAGSGPNVANRIGRNIADAAEAETGAARAAAQRSDDAVTSNWQRSIDDAGREIVNREDAARLASDQSLGNMSTQDMGESLVLRLRAGEQAARENKNRLYDRAANSDAAINADAVGGVRAQVAQSLADDGRVIDGVLTPASSRMMDELQQFSTMNIENRAVGASAPMSAGETPARVAVSVRGIEQTRKRLNAFAQGATNDADRAAARSIIRRFDEWESDAFDNALFSGSESALNSYRQARNANREWRTNFGFNQRDDADRLVNRIVTGEVTPQEVSNWLVGASQVGAKGQSSRLLTRIAEATANDPEAMQAIRGGVWNRLAQNSEGATARAPEKTASGINEFLNGSGRDVARRLFTPEQQGVMRAYADTLRRGQEARQALSDVAKTTKPQAMEVGPGPMQELANTVLGRGGKTDEALFNAVNAYAKSGGRGDIYTLSAILRNIPAQDRGDLAGSVIRNLGVSPRTGEFSPDVFVSQWQTYTPQAKSLLFGNAGAHRQALDDIAMISNRLKQVGRRFGNPSGTAQNVNLGATLMGAWASPLTTLAIVTGAAVAARILASPAGASSASKWSKTYAAVTTRPSAHTIAAYDAASRNLANTAGLNIPSVDFLRALQSPGGGRAQEQDQIPRPPGQ